MIKRLFKAWKTGLQLFLRKPITYKFPPETTVSKKSRGRHIFNADKCISCGLCFNICPNKAIEMVKRQKDGKTVYYPSINYYKCCFCGLCVDSCKKGALEMTNFYLTISMNRNDLIFTPEMLAQPPREEHPEKPKNKSIVSWARSRSLWITNFFSGCCFIEALPWVGSGFDMERFGMIAKGSPIHSDVLLIGGYLTYKTLKRLIRIYKKMSQPKYVLVLGCCPMTGGTYWDSYNTIKNIDNYLPVDMYITGCPPRPESIGYAAYHAILAIEGGYMPKEKKVRMKKELQYRTTDDLQVESIVEKVGINERIVSFGPQHPASSTFSIRLIIEGETVNRAECIAGYLHRGFEKLFEYRTWYQNIMLVARVCVLDGASYEIGYVTAVEKLLKIKIPERAKYLRVIQAELSRIQSHFINLGLVALSSGFDTIMRITLGDRERILFLLDALCGGRIYQSYNIPGGVRSDISDEFKENAPNVIKYIRSQLKILDNLFIENPIFMKRTINLGKIPQDIVFEYDVTGPNIRASGIQFDVRKATPYAAYDKLHFDIPKFDEGDAYHRVLVRRLEIEQSLNLIEECMINLPDGPIKVIEKTILRVNEGEAISFVESARGELCFHIISNGEHNPYRIKIRGPTFGPILFLLPKLLKGCYLADVPIIYWSLDNCPADHDR
ncbi:MAG: NADH-quinone oxidoreductase subunit D [Promethearchaeota archaeon]